MNEPDRDELPAGSIGKSEDRRNSFLDSELYEGDQESVALAETADLLWLAARGAPALADDPVAAMLGLVPDRECSLESSALSRVRKRAGLTVSDIAARLQARGWDFQGRDVFRWETRSASDVAPAVVQAIADILNARIEDLITDPSSAPGQDQFAEIRRHQMFVQLADRWARVRHVSRAVAAAALESRMAATVYRGERPDTEQMLRSLEALVSSVEQAGEESS